MGDTYTLGPRFESLVRHLVESGRYSDPSDVLRDGLRLLEDRERLRAIRIAELRRLAEEGRASGLSDEPADAFFDRLETKYPSSVNSTE